MTTTLAAVEDTDPFLAFHAQRLLDAGYQLVASWREDYRRYEIIVNGSTGEVARGDGECVAEALSYAMLAGGV